jgi:hypothetical protein
MSAREAAFRTEELRQIVEAEKGADNLISDGATAEIKTDRNPRGAGRKKVASSSVVVAAELGVPRTTVEARREQIMNTNKVVSWAAV